MNLSHVQSCAPENWAQISTLIERWPFKPLATHSGEDSPDLFAFTAGRVIRTLESEAGAAWMMMHRDQVRGFASLSLLPWDSQQIGLAAARLDYLVAEGPYPQQHETKKALLQHVVNEAMRRGIWHLSVRVDANDLSSLHVLEQAGFITVDSILTFALNVPDYKSEKVEHGFSIRQAVADDAEDVDRAATLAQKAFTKDRFHSDPLISKDRADQLHSVWTRNSCSGSVADVVLLAEDDQNLLGFVTCKIQRDTAARLGQTVGTIVLVACDETARGRGVGRAMTMAALDWFQQNGCDVVEVGTQLRNITASRLYQNCGFRLVGSSISLRLVL
jgi:dTDP-4-amino-4,6-dideoxy-D-galactose acyltransferase